MERAALTPELRVMRSPRRAYAELARERGAGGMLVALRRPAFVALIQGVAITTAATQTVALPLLASITACWSAAVIVQAMSALLLIRTAPARGQAAGAGSSARRITTARAIDLFFLGHAPWSLWLLLSAGAIVLAPWVPFLRWAAIAGMIVPALLTPRIVTAFDEAILGSTRSQAIRRAGLHQGLTWAALLILIAASVQLWPRVLGLLA